MLTLTSSTWRRVTTNLAAFPLRPLPSFPSPLRSERVETHRGAWAGRDGGSSLPLQPLREAPPEKFWIHITFEPAPVALRGPILYWLTDEAMMTCLI